MGRTKTKAAAQPTLVAEDGKAVAVRDANQGGAVATATSDPIFAIIERLAKDPTFDVEKMERLIKMHQSAKADNARAEFDQAMSLAQQEMMAIRTNAKSDKGKYANYAALDKAIRPIYTKHGFSVSFDTDPGAPELTVRLVATVAHSSGHRERRQLDVPADGKGAKGGDVMTKTHATASAITYGKRYLSGMIWNLAIDHDDDGNAAGDRAKAFTDECIRHLNTAKLDKAALLSWQAQNEKGLAWLKKHAPDEHERYQTAYSNAAEAAGIKKEEPKRGGGKKDSAASAGATPHGDRTRSGQQEPPAAGGAPPTVASGQPAGVTDVVDENATPKKKEPLEFDTFTTTRPFLEFSSKWLAEKGRSPEEARAWEAFYREKMAKLNAESTIAWVKEGLADLMVQYNLIIED